MKVLVDAREKLHIPWQHIHNAEYGKQLLTFDNTIMLDSRLFVCYIPILRNLWKDFGIKQAFERRREFQLVSYLLIL